MERPSFHAVIPAVVRYSGLNASAILLYGEISALCQREGYCWARNSYFAEVFQAGERTVFRWLSELEKAGFIRIEAAVNQFGQRKIFTIESALPKMARQKWHAKNGTPNNDTREENDTREVIPPVSPVQPERKASRRANTGTSLETYLGGSSDLPAEWWERATKAGLTGADIEREWPNFRDYYLASGKRWLKWELVWDRWCRTSRRPRNPQYLTAGQRNARAALLDHAGWATASAGAGSGPGHEPAGGPEADARRF